MTTAMEKCIIVALLLLVAITYLAVFKEEDRYEYNALNGQKELKKQKRSNRLREVTTSTPTLKSTSTSTSTSKPDDSYDGATLNGVPLQYVNHPPRSKLHCIGENFDNQRSWMFRSCKFQTFCINTSSPLDASNFVIFPNHLPLDGPDTWWISTDANPYHNSVLAGGMITKWFHDDIGRFSPRMKWSTVDKQDIPSGYYRLNATLLPFFRHSVSFRNPGHLIWDDFLPLYTLLDIFDREEDRFMLAQMIRPSTTSPQFSERIPPFDIIGKFLPLLGEHKYNISLQEYHWELPPGRPSNETTLICADTALIGNGLFTDHGMTKWHGQLRSDYLTDPFNTGKGGLFRRFRNFLMRNLGVSPATSVLQKPYQILFAQASSRRKTRANVTFRHHEEFVNKIFVRRNINTTRPLLSSMNVKEQVELISKTSIYISTAGGSSSTALFLPKGANLIVFYRSDQLLDFDFWNNFPHIKVHWLFFDRNETTGFFKDFPGGKFAQLIDTILSCFDDESCE